MAEAAKAFFQPFNPALAYLFSDEINLLFPQPAAFRRVEKIDSVFAGIASSKFFEEAKKAFGKKSPAPPIAFDCRAIPVRGTRGIRNYLVWRQAECAGNHDNAWAQWLLEKKGMKPGEVSRALDGIDTKGLKAIAKKHGIDFNKTPAWQRNGVMVVWKRFRKKGFDPIRKKKVVVERRRPEIVWGAPRFDSSEGRKLWGSLA